MIERGSFESAMTQASAICFADVDPSDFDGVLLDLDDTLYRYAPCHDAALLACFEYHDFGLSLADFRLQYRAARTAVTKALSPQAACRSRLFAFQTLVEAAGVPAGYELAYALDETYWSRFIDTMTPDQQALAFVKRCAQLRVPTCIVTDMTAHVQIRKIARLGMGIYIPFLVTSEEVGAEKPDRRMFEAAAGKLGVRGERCLMLGDNLPKDVEGARAAGLTAHLISLPEECDYGG
jgi:HAD superfamily hydrolase (TIGR01549 family)